MIKTETNQLLGLYNICFKIKVMSLHLCNHYFGFCRWSGLLHILYFQKHEKYYILIDLLKIYSYYLR